MPDSHISTKVIKGICFILSELTDPNDFGNQFAMQWLRYFPILIFHGTPDEGTLKLAIARSPVVIPESSFFLSQLVVSEFIYMSADHFVIDTRWASESLACQYKTWGWALAYNSTYNQSCLAYMAPFYVVASGRHSARVNAKLLLRRDDSSPAAESLIGESLGDNDKRNSRTRVLKSWQIRRMFLTPTAERFSLMFYILTSYTIKNDTINTQGGWNLYETHQGKQVWF